MPALGLLGSGSKETCGLSGNHEALGIEASVAEKTIAWVVATECRRIQGGAGGIMAVGSGLVACCGTFRRGARRGRGAERERRELGPAMGKFSSSKLLSIESFLRIQWLISVSPSPRSAVAGQPRNLNRQSTNQYSIRDHLAIGTHSFPIIPGFPGQRWDVSVEDKHLYFGLQGHPSEI